MSVSGKVKCIEGRNKTLSISRQCELLQLPRSLYYRPRSSLAEGPDNLELMRLIDEEFLRHPSVLWQPQDDGLFEPQRHFCKPQTDPTLDAFNGLGVSSSQAKHQQAEIGALGVSLPTEKDLDYRG